MKWLHSFTAWNVYTLLMIPSWLIVPGAFALVNEFVVDLPRWVAAIMVLWIPGTVAVCMVWGVIQSRKTDKEDRARLLTIRPFGSARSL